MFKMNAKVSEDLAHIKTMMERSSRFISLSGLSGIGAGVVGLLTGIGAMYLTEGRMQHLKGIDTVSLGEELIRHLIYLGLNALLAAFFFACFFTIRKSKRLGLKIWTSTTQNILMQLCIPLLIGGIFILALLHYHLYGLIAGASLLFYGLALINAEKYTYSDIKYLGFLEVLLGCISLFYIEKGLLLWTIGFGILHIVYGVVLYKKYK